MSTSSLPEPAGKNVIKRIELVNFMSHARTVIEPAAGLTVLIGPNNCGKSAVVAALQILAHNANSTYVRRHHEKNCEITVETDDGHTIKWSRSRSGSPKYVIDGQDFDRLKGGTPADLAEILRLPKVTSDSGEFDIHFGQQKDPVFLLNDTGKAAAQFFASSSDAIRLVEMQSRHNTKVREAKQTHKRLVSEAERLEHTIEILSETSGVESHLKDCEESYLDLQDALQEVCDLEELVKQLPNLDRQVQQFESLAGLLAQTSAPPHLEPTESLESLVRQLSNLMKLETKNAHRHQILSAACPPPQLADEIPLEQSIGLLESAIIRQETLDRQWQQLRGVQPPPETEQSQPLEAIILEFEQTQTRFQQLTRKLASTTEELAIVTADSERWAASHPVCPTCGASTDAQKLLTVGPGGCGHG